MIFTVVENHFTFFFSIFSGVRSEVRKGCPARHPFPFLSFRNKTKVNTLILFLSGQKKIHRTLFGAFGKLKKQSIEYYRFSCCVTYGMESIPCNPKKLLQPGSPFRIREKAPAGQISKNACLSRFPPTPQNKKNSAICRIFLFLAQFLGFLNVTKHKVFEKSLGILLRSN